MTGVILKTVVPNYGSVHPLNKNHRRVVQSVKAYPAKSVVLVSIPRSKLVEGENQFPHVI